MMEYKFVEVAIVTDEELTRVVNEMLRHGWALDGVHFAMRENSKRPAMAFIAFTRRTTDGSTPKLDKSP